MWIDAQGENACLPLVDGEYFVQTVYGRTLNFMYTRRGGWNSYIDSEGKLHSSDSKFDLYIVRWYKLETPPAVPKEWVKAYHISEGRIRGNE